MKSPKTPFWGHRDIPSNSMYLVCVIFWRKTNREAQSALLKQQINRYMSLGTERNIRKLGLRVNDEHCPGSNWEGLLEEATWAES